MLMSEVGHGLMGSSRRPVRLRLQSGAVGVLAAQLGVVAAPPEQPEAAEAEKAPATAVNVTNVTNVRPFAPLVPPTCVAARACA